MNTKIGWSFVNVEGTAAYPEPQKVYLGKDPSLTNRGHLSCPAVRSVVQGFYTVNSPFSLKLRFKKNKDSVSLVPIYPFTSINEAMLSEIIRLEPRDQWRNDYTPLFQIPSPYFFFSDEPIDIEQTHPVLSHTSSFNWRLIPGKFNIHGWHRPLNWAIEWDTKCGDLVIKLGEPLYFVRFYDKDSKLIVNPNLVKKELNDDLRSRLNSTAGVTAFRRGTTALIKSSSDARDGKLI